MTAVLVEFISIEFRKFGVTDIKQARLGYR